MVVQEVDWAFQDGTKVVRHIHYHALVLIFVKIAIFYGVAGIFAIGNYTFAIVAVHEGSIKQE